MAAKRSQFIVHGWVATAPELRTLESGRVLTTFRIADSIRRRDPEAGGWTDTKTTWYTVRVWGDQAVNVADSIRRSDPVIVIGHPWLEQWTNTNDEPGSTLVIDADSVTPDLSFGVTHFTRKLHSSSTSSNTATAANGDIEQDSADQTPPNLANAKSEGYDVDAIVDELLDDANLSADRESDLV